MSKLSHSDALAPHPALISPAFFLDPFQKIPRGNSMTLSEKKKKTLLETLQKMSLRKGKQEKSSQGLKYAKSSESGCKFQKFYSHRDSSEIIDRILLKNALLNLKAPPAPAPNNTSIEDCDLFMPLAERLPLRESEKSHYRALLSQKTDLSTTHSSQLEPKTIRRTQQQHLVTCKNTIKSTNLPSQYAKLRYDELRQRSENPTPTAGSEWEQSMNLIREEKRENEKARKYCRIMIRRINTDQLYTKRKDPHSLKDKSPKGNPFKTSKVIRPVPNQLNETSFTRTSTQPQQIEHPLFTELETMQLNPWSTTELKLAPVSELIQQ